MNGTILYTMYSGLGDFIAMTNVKRMAQSFTGYRVIIAHRANPYIDLLSPIEREDFFNIYSARELALLRGFLSKRRYPRFGIQQAPGSIQGFSFLYVLKKAGAIDFIVDFNLINADIRTPPRGSYILDLHRNQLVDLFNLKSPAHYQPSLPFEIKRRNIDRGGTLYGISPLSGKKKCNTFTWPFHKWKELIGKILEMDPNAKFLLILTREDGHLYSELRNFFPEQLKIMDDLSVPELAGVISDLDYLITVNSAPVHIAYILEKKTVVLSGPSIEVWNPQASFVRVVHDRTAIYPPSDQCERAEGVPSVSNIEVSQVIEALEDLKKSGIKSETAA